MNLERVPGLQQLNPVARLEAPQVSLLSSVLSRVFYNEPHFVYLIPDEETRRTVSPRLFQAAIRASQIYGEIYTTDTAAGGALWMSPEHDWTIARLLRMGMMGIPFNLEWGIFKRCLKLGARVAEVRRQLATGSHWYLMALGVEKSRDEEEIAGALIEPVLARADATGMSCYLETFNEKKLKFYKNHGFRIMGAGKIPGGPSFWAMTRAPTP